MPMDEKAISSFLVAEEWPTSKCTCNFLRVGTNPTAGSPEPQASIKANSLAKELEGCINAYGTVIALATTWEWLVLCKTIAEDWSGSCLSLYLLECLTELTKHPMLTGSATLMTWTWWISYGVLE